MLSYTFELFPDENSTTLKLTHTGIESFSQDNPDFTLESFTQGWTYLICESLKNYLESSSEQLQNNAINYNTNINFFDIKSVNI